MSPSVYNLPPQETQVLVIGGGPAGSYAASVLAREGISVTVLEAAKFPRYHVGESLIPSVRHYMRFIGADSKLANYGFVHKPGSAIKFNQFKREGYTDFMALGTDNAAFNVTRSEFDHLLMNHARSSGVSVYEQTRVTSISFSPTDSKRPISASWSHIPPPSPLSPPASPTTTTHVIPEQPVEPHVVTGTTTFTHLIDASGRAGVMSTMYLKNRHFNSSLKNIAVWGYWKEAGTYGLGTAREGSPWFEALTDASGWAWFIPLHNGTTSVGIVMNQKVYHEKIKEDAKQIHFSSLSAPNPSASKTVDHYLCNIGLAPGVLKLLGTAVMQTGSVKSATDYSYSAPLYADRGFRIIGDAGAFIDPFFSSGVHLALTSALSAAATICASIRGDCTESFAADWHTKRVSTSYTRFQVVVLSAYMQIRNSQSADVLSDINEDNFDRAFYLLRPVIQGAGDMGKLLSETELQKSLDFCVNLFSPTSPEEHHRVASQAQISQKLLDVTAPLVDPAVLEKALHVEHIAPSSQKTPPATKKRLNNRDRSASEVAETRMVLNKINARRIVHAEYAINNFESEPIAGYVVKLEKGSLGLRRPSIVLASTPELAD